MRVLIIGWASFLHGEATAGDVLSMQRVATAVASSGIPCDTAWSPGFAPEELAIDDTRPEDYTHVVFVCGPLHGWQVAEVHERYADCRRVAVGVSVVDPEDPAVTGFHRVFPRDGADAEPTRDLGVPRQKSGIPVAGVVLAPGQREYEHRCRHDAVHEQVLRWLAGLDCARLPLETRLDPDDWRLCSTVDQFTALIARADVVVTSRLHGLVFALAQGVPALAVDPVSRTGKVTAQANAWQWPAILGADDLLTPERGGQLLDHWWNWCLTSDGRSQARARRSMASEDSVLPALMAELHAAAPTQEPA